MARIRRKIWRDIIAKAARATKAALTIQGFVKNPINTSIKVALNKATSLDKYRKLRGMYRNRVQYLNPRTKRWIIKDTRTGKIVWVKKTPGPAKNIRKVIKKRRK